MSPRSPSRSTSFKRIACAITPPRLALCHVGQESKLPGALDRTRELTLVAAAVAGDAGRADLALLAHGAAKRREVLVVDDVDLVLAEVARLAPAPARRALPSVSPAAAFGLLPASGLRHSGRTSSAAFSAERV